MAVSRSILIGSIKTKLEDFPNLGFLVLFCGSCVVYLIINGLVPSYARFAVQLWLDNGDIPQIWELLLIGHPSRGICFN